VDEHGWVAHAAGIAAHSRIAVPDGDRALSVPGLGLCVADPMADGWLVRPAGRETRLAITVDLAGTPSVQVTGGHQAWRGPLTTRHAEILLLVHRRDVPVSRRPP
jgi:hypothetical protein